MRSNLQKVYWAIRKRGTDKFALIQGELPIYWNKKTAQRRAAVFPDSEVVRIDGEQLNLLIGNLIKQ